MAAEVSTNPYVSKSESLNLIVHVDLTLFA